jgi:hypothetical protein
MTTLRIVTNPAWKEQMNLRRVWLVPGQDIHDGKFSEFKTIAQQNRACNCD